MKTKQLIELLSGFDPDSTVRVVFPAHSPPLVVNLREVSDDIIVEELARYDGMHPLISIDGAHLLED